LSGTTSSLSLSRLKESDEKLQVNLLETLKLVFFLYLFFILESKIYSQYSPRKFNCYETEEEIQKREKVLAKLKTLLMEYSLHEGISQGYSEKEAATKELQLRTFGSYRLGVHSPEADIDTYVYLFAVYVSIFIAFCPDRLCVAPSHCSRISFFQKVPILLEAHSYISELHVIPDAYVHLTYFSSYYNHFSFIKNPIDLFLSLK
jgi:poly(A) polymerase Pap1